MKTLKLRLLTSVVLVGLLLMASGVLAGETVPEVKWLWPGGSHTSAITLPYGYIFPLKAFDGDSPDLMPIKYRYLLKAAEVDGVTITSMYHWDQYGAELMSFDDPGWTEWMDFRVANEQPERIHLPDLVEGEYYLLAAQVMDSDGTVSGELSYSYSVLNFYQSSYQFSPQILGTEQFLGIWTQNRNFNIASGQPLNVSFIGSAEGYGGTIVSLRYGWDVVDTSDPNDPGWAIPAGAHGEGGLVVPEQEFQDGLHSLVAHAVDSYGNERFMTAYFNVIPFVSPDNQLPLMLIDQVIDSNTGRWPDSTGTIAYDHEDYRNEFWRFLDGGTGVQEFNWQRDRRDHTEDVSYADIVNYKALIVTARAHSQQGMFNDFRPENNTQKYVWLAPYQAQGGNLFLAGDRSMESFLEMRPNYMVPLVFTSTEEYYYLNDEAYVTGFGEGEDPDGSTFMRGPRMYPYLTAGIASLDWSVPDGKYVYGRTNQGNEDRTQSCSGLKAMVLKEDFRSNHQIEAGALADTIWTNGLIDWRDPLASAGLDTMLSLDFPFTGDELVDDDIAQSSLSFTRQECEEGPNDFCIEPMYTGQARMDWMREEVWAEGNTDWPTNVYTDNELQEICGEMALTAHVTPEGEFIPFGSARTNGRTYGYLSYKNVAQKPSGKADVYWGFDPYRFDHQASKESVRWVLDYFGLPMNR